MDVSAVLAHIADQQRLPGLGYRAHDSLAEAETPVPLHFGWKALGELEVELAAPIVQQQYGEGVVVEEVLEPVRHLLQPLTQGVGGPEIPGSRQEPAQAGGKIGLAAARFDRRQLPQCRLCPGLHAVVRAAHVSPLTPLKTKEKPRFFQPASRAARSARSTSNTRTGS